MKIFVDLRDQDTGYRFAWWDTCYDKFESFQGEYAFDTWKDFVEVYDGDELGRYKGLCPEWVFKKYVYSAREITRILVHRWQVSNGDRNMDVEMCVTQEGVEIDTYMIGWDSIDAARQTAEQRDEAHSNPPA